MKIGANIWSFPAEYTMEQCFALAKEKGFTGVEVSMEEHPREGDVRLHMEDPIGSAKAVKALADKYQLELPSVATSLFWKYTYGDLDPKNQQMARQVTKAMIDAATVFESSAILVLAATVTDQVSYQRSYETTREALEVLAPYAEEKQVIIGLENVWNKALTSAYDLATIVDQVNSPFVQIYFDIGNVLLFGYPEHWIPILGQRICKIHIKDFDRTQHAFMPLLSGELNWKATIQALREIGYKDYLMVEVAPYNDYPDMTLEHSYRSMVRMLEE